MEIKIIASMSQNGVIGKDGKIPWHIPEYMEKFKDITQGQVVIMGRKLFESLGQPLRGRVNIVLTRDQNFVTSYPNVHVFHTLKSCLNHCLECKRDEIYFIGGQEIFRQAIAIADEIILCILQKEYSGDKSFPKISNIWEKKSESFDETSRGIMIRNIRYVNTRSTDSIEPEIVFPNTETMTYRTRRAKTVSQQSYNKNRRDEFNYLIEETKNRNSKKEGTKRIDKQDSRESRINDYKKYLEKEEKKKKKKEQFEDIVKRACAEVEERQSHIQKDKYLDVTKKKKTIKIPVVVRKRKRRRRRRGFGDSNTMVLRVATDIDKAKKIRENTIVGRAWKTMGQIAKRRGKEEDYLVVYIVMFAFVMFTLCYIIASLIYIPQIQSMENKIDQNIKKIKDTRKIIDKRE